MIKVLLQKEARVFKNSYLKTRKQIIIALVLLIAGLMLVGGITWALVSGIRYLLADIPPEMAMLVITPLFYLILIWLLFANFSLMLQEARSRFYHSPELSLLVSSPISADTLFVFRFILVTCLSKAALMNLPFVMSPLIALGIVSAAPWYYYPFIPLVGYLLLVISTCFAVVVVMLLVKVISPKRLMQAGAVLGLLSTVLWIGFFILGPVEILPQLLEWVRGAEPVWEILFPLTDAAAILGRLVQGEMAFVPLLRLFFASGVILAGAMLAAKRLYYSGYDRTQTIEVSTRKRVQRPAKEPLTLGRRSNFILTEWKKAVRNYEMMQGAIVPFLMLIAYPFLAGGFAPPGAWGNLVPLGHIAVIGFLASGAVMVFFVPAAILQDPKALKEQYSLLKSAPFGGVDFILCDWLAQFIPQILLSGTTLLALNIFMGSSILTTLLSLVVLALLVGSVGTLSRGLDMVGYSRQRETDSLPGRVLRNVSPILYYILALGILAPGLIFTGMTIAISSAAFLALVGFIFCYSFRLGAKCWEEMEI